MLRDRDGRWLRTRITGLLRTDSRLARCFEFAVPLNQRHLPIGGLV